MASSGAILTKGDNPRNDNFSLFYNIPKNNKIGNDFEKIIPMMGRTEAGDFRWRIAALGWKDGRNFGKIIAVR
jgi:hypothetical protein